MKLFFALLFLSTFSFSSNEEITVEKYPDADTVVVNSKEETYYKADGTYTTDYEEWTKVLTEKGRRNQSSFSTRFNARYGTAIIAKISIIGEDGKERNVDFTSTLKNTTDNSSASANIYDPQDRKLSCAVPGLKIGETLYTKIRHVTNKARVENEFADISVFEGTSPILRQEVTIHSPAEKPLKKIAVRHPLGNVTYSCTTNKDNSLIHHWLVKDSPQAFPEPDMPPMYTQVQNLRVSTIDDWKALSKWYWNLSLPHLEKTNEAMSLEVKKIGKDIEKIYQWVSQEVRYMGLTLEDVSPGYAPHDVNITFDNRYGVCRDKAALLVAMLRIAGFDAYPVLIHAGAKMDNEIPSPYFNHAIVAVHAPKDMRANKDGYILMDPTDESSRDLFPSYLSDKSYLVARPDGETLLTSQTPNPKENEVSILSKGTLTADGDMIVEAHIKFLGINDNIYRRALLRRKPDDQRMFFDRIIRDVVPGAELMSSEITPKNLADTEKELSVKLSFRAPEMLLNGESISELNVPFLSRELGIANFLLTGSTSLEERKYPLVLPSTASVDERVEVNLKALSGEVLSLPETLSLTNSYAFNRSFTVTNDMLVATRNISLNDVEYSPKEYDELREDIKRVEIADRARAKFSNKKLQDEQMHYKLKKKEIGLISDREWVVTNVIEVEVLSYEGKKRLSELTYTYNPLVGYVEVLDAKVTSKAGKVSKVTEKERNIFDCSWAGAAPRYPASKKLVVNLPAVEIGSTISYTVVTTVTNSPLPFYDVTYFDAMHPTDEIYYNITCHFEEEPDESVRKRVRSWDMSLVPDNKETDYRHEKNVKLRKRETRQAPLFCWRDCRVVSMGDFDKLGENLRVVSEVEPYNYKEIDDLLEDVDDNQERIKIIRDWMYKYVRVVGPSLYELPFEHHITSPEIVFKDRYASRLDYMRALCAILKGAGYDADILFAGDTSSMVQGLLDFHILAVPMVNLFSTVICRVRYKEGGFLWFGGEEYEMFIGRENQFTPIGISEAAGNLIYDPLNEEKHFKAIPEIIDMVDTIRVKNTISIRENGDIDFDRKIKIPVSGLGDFRKKYTEMLPEEKSRHYQEIIGDISQGAVATSEFITDIDEGQMSYSVYIPKYATIDNDTITFTIPIFKADPFAISGTTRETPILLTSRLLSENSFQIKFPKGYTKVEHLPEVYDFVNPLDASESISSTSISFDEDEDGCISVNYREETYKQRDMILEPIYFKLLKDWSRMINSRANRTIILRKEKDSKK